MSTNREIIKVTITPLYSTTGSGTIPCGYIKTTYYYSK